MAYDRKEAREKPVAPGSLSVVAGFKRLLVPLAAEMGLSSVLQRLTTPEGEETLRRATRAFLTEVARTLTPIWRVAVSGPTADQLLARIEASGRKINSPELRRILTKIPTTTGVTYRLALIQASECGEYLRGADLYAAVREMATDRGYRNPPAEVALLLAQFRQPELHQRCLTVMHDPIDGNPILLTLYRTEYSNAFFAPGEHTDSDSEPDPQACDQLGDSIRGHDQNLHAFVFLAP